MKVSKFKIAILVLLAVTVIYVIALNQGMQAYETWKNEQYPEYIRPWVDFAPFYATPQGLLFCLCGFGLVSTWIFAFLTKTKNSKAPILAVILLMAYLCTVPFSFATDVDHVDVYCVRDEESEVSPADPVLPFLRQYYLDNFNIDFHWHKWYYWESDDSLGEDTVEVLYDAIHNFNWYWSKVIDGEPMELMMVYSGQISALCGESPPWERAFIVGWGYGNLFYHEMGHQFDCDHCREFDIFTGTACWMHEDSFVVGEFGQYYCTHHHSTIMANRDCLLKPVPTMKTQADGWFYIPNFSPDILTIEMVFNNQNLTGDQVGVSYYPNGVVDAYDLRLIGKTFGLKEGESGWDYMADIVPDGEINGYDLRAFCGNYGNSGTYITDLFGVRVIFNTGEMEHPRDPTRHALIPEGATSFTVERYDETKFEYVPIGAMITFWKTY